MCQCVRTDSWSGDLGDGGEGWVALEAKLTGKPWSWEEAHISTVVLIVIPVGSTDTYVAEPPLSILYSWLGSVD